MIIAFSGVKFAGKDTAAEGLIRSYGFKRIGLADRLKDICSHVFSICRKDMDDPSKKETAFEEPISINSEHIRDLLDLLRFDGFLFDMESTCRDICKNFIGKILTSIRDMLQTVGTDICRTYIQDDIWLCYIKSLITPAHNYVITDARFKNERDYLKDLGAILILIKRPGYESKSTHISENQLGLDSDYDVVVDNISTPHAMQSSLCMWYSVKKDAIKSGIKR
jgi:hypothetical protein